MWTSFYAARVAAEQLLGRCQQRQSPAILTAVLVVGIYEILGYDISGHLQFCYKAVETAAHVPPGESACGAQIARNHAAVFLQSEQNALLNASR